MYEKRHEYRPKLGQRFSDKVSSILNRNNFIWIGREDGVVDFIDIDKISELNEAGDYERLLRDRKKAENITRLMCSDTNSITRNTEPPILAIDDVPQSKNLSLFDSNISNLDATINKHQILLDYPENYPEDNSCLEDYSLGLFGSLDKGLFINNKDNPCNNFSIDNSKFSTQDNGDQNQAVSGSFTVFNSEFDYFENEDVAEKINCLDVMTTGGVNSIAFFGNDRNIKVFSIRNDASTLNICKQDAMNEYKAVEVKKIQNVHSYLLNSISLNCTNDYLLTADHIKINLWRPHHVKLESSIQLNNANESKIANYGYSSYQSRFKKGCNYSNDSYSSREVQRKDIILQLNNTFKHRLETTIDYFNSCSTFMENYFNLVNIKNKISEGSIHVINMSKFSPFDDSIYGYSSSNGELILNDLTLAPRSQSVMAFKNTYVQCIKSISDFAFVQPNILATRSVNNVCIFDTRNPKSPLILKELSTSSHEQNLLNSGDSIYEKFKITSTSARVFTGTFFGTIVDYDIANDKMTEFTILDSRKNDPSYKVKNVVATKDGFVCSMNGTIYEYKKVD